MSQRIEDTLSVLRLMKTNYGPARDVTNLRIEATERVAEGRRPRRVTKQTVFAHIVGKEPAPNTLAAWEFDQITKEWLRGSPRALREWLLLVASQRQDYQDRQVILDFFQ
jgi:hypothetical protein